MKKSQLLLLTAALLLSISFVKSQELVYTEINKISTTLNPNFSKGKSQLAIEGLNFGFGYGRIIGSLGVRYGYFVANNKLLFVNGEASYWGSNSLQAYKAGLNYRQYFNCSKVRPYAQIGANMGWENYSEDKHSIYYDVTIGGGVTFQVGKFGFEMGMQVNIWDNVTFRPQVGVSYTF